MTKKMEVIFQRYPPEPFKTLDDVVDYWDRVFGPNGPEANRRDEVVAFCTLAPDLNTAIQWACNSLRPNGNMHNHQSRVRKQDRDLFARRIQNELSYINIIHFDELHDLLEEIAPHGIGPVTIYDVATRIAAYMKLPVKSLYLHAGVRIGLHRLYGRRMFPDNRIEITLLPKALLRLDPDTIEDFLCTFKEQLHPGLINDTPA